MTKEDVYKEITANKKWYHGYCTQQSASQLMKRWESNTLSHEKMCHLFNAFNYQINVSWEKTK